MKKILFLLSLSFILLSFVRVRTNINHGKLSETQLDFVKQNFNWTTEDVIIVNFKQPRNKCHYDAYQNLKVSTKWWTGFNSQMDLKNIQNIFVYSDSKKAKNSFDSKTHFADTNAFFLNHFFSEDITCEGVIIIHKNGAYRKKAGEYIQKEIETFISQLKSM